MLAQPPYLHAAHARQSKCGLEAPLGWVCAGVRRCWCWARRHWARSTPRWSSCCTPAEVALDVAHLQQRGRALGSSSAGDSHAGRECETKPRI